MREIRCFISSPGDVGQERLIAVRVIERLQVEFRQRLTLTPIVWEHEPLRASEHFQAQIVPPDQTDVVICILWSRLGTRLPAQFRRPDGSTYQSGTEWEFENALASFRKRGTPDLLVYRKTSEAVASLQSREQLLARLEQKEALDQFIDRWFGNADSGFRAAFHCFDAADQFERLLETHLRSFLANRVGPIPVAPTGPREGTWHKGNPFRGLSPYDVEHSEIFFGRTRAVGELKNRLQKRGAEGSPFVLVVGMSGSGKSSLVRAGLVPVLTVPGVVEGIGLWRHAIVRPADAGGPSRVLGTALVSKTALPNLAELGFGSEQAGELLNSRPELLIAPLRAALDAHAKAAAQSEKLEAVPAARLLLVIDQLEEIFTGPDGTDESRRQFAVALETLVRSGLVWVVATMRSDMYSRLASVPQLLKLKGNDGQYDLLPPSSGEIEQMIQYPAKVAGVWFESDPQTGVGLDKTILESASGNPEALPLLGFILDQLYKSRDQSMMTFAAYRQLGGLEGAIARRAEEVLVALPEKVQARLPGLFEACVSLTAGADGSAAAIRVPKTRVLRTEDDETLIETLVLARLLVTDTDLGGVETIGFAHEALLRHWPRLTGWLRENEELLRARARVTVAAEIWNASSRNPEYLLATGKPLAVAESLLETRVPLSPLVVEFVELSAKQVRQASRRRLWIAGVIGAAFLVLSSAFAIYSYSQWRYADSLKTVADRERDEAIEKRKEAVAAREREAEALRKETETRVARDEALAQTRIALERADFNLAFRNPTLAMQHLSDNRVTTAKALLGAMPETMRHWEWHHVARRCREESKSLSMDGELLWVDFSQKSPRVAVSIKNIDAFDLNSPGHRIEVWDCVKMRKVAELGPLAAPADQVVLPGKGETAVCISAAELTVWNVDSGNQVSRFDLGNATLAAISDDGTTAAVVHESWHEDNSRSYELRLIDVATGTEKSRWKRGMNAGNQMTLSSDGTLILVSEDYCGLVLFEAGKEDPVWVHAQPAGSEVSSTIFCADLNPERGLVATGSYDGIVRVQFWQDGSEPKVLRGHNGAVVSVKFSGDGKLLTAGWDSTIRVWDLDNRKELDVYRGHENWIRNLSASPTGGTIASVSRDQQLKFWEPPVSARPIRTFESMLVNVEGVAWSPDGKRVVTCGMMTNSEGLAGCAIRVVNLAMKGYFDVDVSAAAFLVKSRFSNQLATTGGFGVNPQVRLLEFDSESPFGSGLGYVAPLEGPASTANSAEFLDAGTIAVGWYDGSITVHDIAGETFEILAQLGSPVLSLRLQTVTGVLYVGCGGGELIAMDLVTGKRIGETRFGGPVRDIEIRPKTGEVLVAAGYTSQPGLIVLMNQDLSTTLRRFSGHSDLVTSLSFVPDGSRFASGSHDRSVRIWDPDTGLEAISLRGHQREVTCLEFDAAGNQLASGDEFGTVILWDGTPVSPELDDSR